MGPKCCAQSFEALRRGRNGSEWLRVEGGKLGALHPYGCGCARFLNRPFTFGQEKTGDGLAGSVSGVSSRIVALTGIDRDSTASPYFTMPRMFRTY